MTVPVLVAAVMAAGSACAQPGGITRDEYLDLVEAAVAAYPEDHVAEYIDDADRNSVGEHGFPRLTANFAALVAAGRHPERLGQLKRMMDICCRDAKKGLMRKEGNEFSVKELVDALCDIEQAGLFPKDVTDSWRRDIAEVDPWRCYRIKPEVGDTKKSYNWCVFGAARFRSAAARAVAGTRRWLAERPVRHVKNLYQRSWKRGTGIGCENYAYFDKYMVTMGSWAVLARRFADETPLPYVEDRESVAFETTPYFHFVFLRAGGYSAQFDYNADTRYDCDGLGRLHRRGAPTQICVSTPCAAAPTYSTEMTNVSSLAIVPVSKSPLKPAGSGSDGSAAWAAWTLGDLDWRCRLTDAGLESTLKGSGQVAMRLPAFAFDGERATQVSCDGRSLEVRYRGWVCRYDTDGTVRDTGEVCCNRNGRYLAFEACGEKSLSVKVSIAPSAICNAEICPETFRRG